MTGLGVHVPLCLLAFLGAPSWLWVISVLSLALAALSLVSQVVMWWRDRHPRILIRQVGSSITDRVRRTDQGTIYTADIAIINQSPRTAAVVCRLILKLPWQDDMFNLLPGP